MQLQNINGKSIDDELMHSTNQDPQFGEEPINQIEATINQLQKIDQTIQSLKIKIINANLQELKNELDLLPNIRNISHTIRSYFQQAPKQKCLYEIPIQMENLCQTIQNDLFEVPVEMMPFDQPRNLYEIPIEIALMPDLESVDQYLSSFQSFQMLPQQLQKTIQNLSSKIHRQACIYEIPVQLNYPEKQVQLYEIPVQMQFREECNSVQIQTQIQTQVELQRMEQENTLNYKLQIEHWKYIDQTVQRMSSLMKLLPTSKYEPQTQDNIVFTGSIKQDMKLLSEQKIQPQYCQVPVQLNVQQEPRIYQIPVQLQPFSSQQSSQPSIQLIQTQVQCDLQYPLYKEVPITVDMEPILPDLSISSNLYDICLMPTKLQEMKIQSIQIQQSITHKQPTTHKEKLDSKLKRVNSIQLSASIQSVYYEDNTTNAMNNLMTPTPAMTPISNVAVAGWDNHPQLDFCDSSEIASKSNNNESFGSSFTTQKQSLQFKESCIQQKMSQSNNFINKVDVNSIFQTMNFKNNDHPIYIIASESSQDSEIDREMYLSEMQERNQVKMNTIVSNNNNKINNYLHNNIHNKMKQQQVQISQYFNMKQRLAQAEQDKVQLQQQLRLSQQQTKTLKDEINLQKEALSTLQVNHQQKMQSINRQLQILNDQIHKVQASGNKKEEQIQKMEEEMVRIGIQKDKYRDNEHKHKQQLEQYRKQVIQLNNNIQKVQKQFQHNAQKLQSQLNDKDQYILSLEKQCQELKECHKGQLSDFIKVNDELRNHIEELSKDIDNKKYNIEQLTNNHDQLITHLETACRERNQYNSIKDVYVDEYNKMKECFDQQSQQKNKQIKDLSYDNQRLHKEILEYLQNRQASKNTIHDLQMLVQALKEELDCNQEELKKPKINISSHVQAEMDYLRRQLIFLTSEVDARDLKIKEINLQIHQKAKYRDLQPLTIDFCQNDNAIYINELKDIISEYEKIIISHHGVIKELQDRVYEYLGDAIEKEQQAQRLYDSVLNYESDINEVMLEKIAVDLENKKLRRMIASSEKKMSAIGNRLIYVAKDKMEDDSHLFQKLQGRIRRSMKNQDSTIKLRSD